MTIRTYIILLLASIGGILHTQPAWDDTLNFDEIEQRLTDESVIKMEDMRTFLKKSGKLPSGTHPVTMVTLKSGLKGVFKKDGYHGEVVAYRICKALGLRLVPPTVYKNLKGTEGSFQFFVESPIDLKKVADREYYENLGHKDLCDDKMLHYLLCRWDTKSGNQLIAKHDDRYYLALIDNAGIRSLIHKSPLTTDTFYASTLAALKKLDRETLTRLWSCESNENRRTFHIERMLKCIKTIFKRAQLGTIISG